MNTRTVFNNALMIKNNASMLGRQMWTLLVLLAMFGLSAHAAMGQGAFKLNGQGSINLAPQGVSPFAFTGTASPLGQYKCNGEIALRSGKDQEARTGAGVAVFETANGDRLVGIASLQTNADGAGQITFTWCDSVRFNNGTVISCTGQFARSRPAPVVSPIKSHLLVVIAIIAILIG